MQPGGDGYHPRQLPTAAGATAAVQDVDIHPSERVLASGVIDGHLVLHDFTKHSQEQRHKLKAS